MAKLLKLRRGTTSQHSSFTGAEGEVTVDTDKETIVVHDGSTAGGHPVAAEDMANVSSASIVGRLGTGSVVKAKLEADIIDGTKLADNACDSEHYTDGSVDHVHLAADAVDGDNIADDSINSEHYVDASIDHQHLSNDCIDGDNIQDDVINSEHYAAGSVDHEHLANDIIDGDNIQDDVINSEHIAAGAVDLEHMSSESVDEDNLKISNAGSNGQYLQKQSGDTGGLTWANVDTGGDPTVQQQFTSSGSYTVPSGVTTIRAYAVGAGGDGGEAIPPSPYWNTGGAGGGMAYGDFTVSAGNSVTITISSGVATVAYGGTTLLTGNKGADGVDDPSSSSNAAGGTASKHASVTNGGAYSGGDGGSTSAAGPGIGGSSAGSPLGTGSKAIGAGGCGIGHTGTWNSMNGGGGGAASNGGPSNNYITGGSGPSNHARDGVRYALYTDPLIKACVMPGKPLYNGTLGWSPRNYPFEEAPGVGGFCRQGGTPSIQHGNGGSFAGGGGGGINYNYQDHDIEAGHGGILGGGGSAGGQNATYKAGNGGYGGGGGSCNHYGSGTLHRGSGGGAAVWIFHT